MQDEIKNIKQSFNKELDSANSQDPLEKIRIKYLGRKGIVSDLMGKLPTLDKSQKPIIGKELNLLKILKAGGVALEVSPNNWALTYAYLLSLKRNYRAKKYRKYLLKSLQSHAEEIDK